MSADLARKSGVPQSNESIATNLPRVVELEITIQAPIARLWKALARETGQWWRKDRYTDASARNFIIEPVIGGKMYEDWGHGEGLAWATVTGVRVPQVLELSGVSATAWGGPNTDDHSFRLEEKGASTILRFSDAVHGRIDDATATSSHEGGSCSSTKPCASPAKRARRLAASTRERVDRARAARSGDSVTRALTFTTCRATPFVPGTQRGAAFRRERRSARNSAARSIVRTASVSLATTNEADPRSHTDPWSRSRVSSLAIPVLVPPIQGGCAMRESRLSFHLVWVLAALLFTFARHASAQFQQESHTHVISSLSVPGSLSFPMPRFDPAHGTLRSISITLDSSLSGSFALENTNAASASITLRPAALLTLNALHLPTTAAPAFEPVAPIALLPFDGTLDFGGVSGVTQSFGPSSAGTPLGSASSSQNAAFDTYCGPLGSPGTLGVALQTAIDPAGAPQPSDGIVLGGSWLVAATVTLTYTYEVFPAKFCDSGAGVLPACPCGNQGVGPNGCANSVNTAGAALEASGTPSLSSDTFTLEAAGMPNSIAIFLQGDASNYNGVGFGDGRRCIFGSLLRIGNKPVSGGGAQYPEVGNASISFRGDVLAPGLRYYQAHYRNAASFCTSATFNATNALAVRWSP